jgi:hypothetical protein
MTMKKLNTVIMVLVLVAITACSADRFAKISIKVVDESGMIVSGALVSVGFASYTNNSDYNENIKKEPTSEQGIASLSGSCSGIVTIKVEKDGYYNSTEKFYFKNSNMIRWTPWNPEIEVKIRSIDNPVPMYARSISGLSLEVPALNKDIGFDLIKADWIAPYGEGVTADFIFNLSKEYISRRNYNFQLDVSFLNSADGVIEIIEEPSVGSDLILPKEAPLNGYVNKFIEYVRWAPNSEPEMSWSNDRHYIFRVRSGTSTGAMYGKIINGIQIEKMEEGSASLKFKYYLNPDGTNNLEYDPTKNLFIDLPQRERVGI